MYLHDVLLELIDKFFVLLFELGSLFEGVASGILHHVLDEPVYLFAFWDIIIQVQDLPRLRIGCHSRKGRQLLLLLLRQVPVELRDVARLFVLLVQFVLYVMEFARFPDDRPFVVLLQIQRDQLFVLLLQLFHLYGSFQLLFFLFYFFDLVEYIFFLICIDEAKLFVINLIGAIKVDRVVHHFQF